MDGINSIEMKKELEGRRNPILGLSGSGISRHRRPCVILHSEINQTLSTLNHGIVAGGTSEGIETLSEWTW